jgi:hypothetical protein
MTDPTPVDLDTIEVAAQALHEAVEAQCVNRGMRIKWGSKQQDEATRNSYREQARAALTAAGFGVLRAQRDAALAVCDNSMLHLDFVDWVRVDAVRAALGVQPEPDND